MMKCPREGCTLEAPTSRGLCILHDPSPAKDAAAFRQALEERLARAEADPTVAAVDLRGIVAPGPLVWYRRVFPKAVDWSGARFLGEVHLFGAVFEQEARFAGAVFQAEASFWDAAFSGEADFAGAVFHGEAGFQMASFQETADFRGTEFRGPARFGEASFGGRADFAQASFRGPVDFEGAAFPEGLAPPVAASGGVQSRGGNPSGWRGRLAAAWRRLRG